MGYVVRESSTLEKLNPSYRALPGQCGREAGEELTILELEGEGTGMRQLDPGIFESQSSFFLDLADEDDSIPSKPHF